MTKFKVVISDGVHNAIYNEKADSEKTAVELAKKEFYDEYSLYGLGFDVDLETAAYPART